MPSHIFVQLGMWDDVVASNIVAYKAAVDLAEAKKLPRGREDFHTLSWLQYAYLQQGKFDDAQKCVDQAKAVADKDTAPNVRDGYASMKARQVVETRAVGETGAADRRRQGRRRARLRRQRGLCVRGGRQRRQPRRSRDRQRGAREAEGDAHAGRVGVERVSRASRSPIMEKEVGAVIAFAQKDIGDRRAADQGSDRRSSWRSTRRRVRPIRSSRRSSCMATCCSTLNRPAEAAAQFQQSLNRMPNRRAALKGLERATAQRQTTAPQ